jgi:ATP-dependent Lon protease
VLERLGSLPPRDMRKKLMAAFGSAKLEGRNCLEEGDFELARMGRSRKIGF